MAAIPRRDRGERDDARSGGNYRVALTGSSPTRMADQEECLSLSLNQTSRQRIILM